MKTIKHNKKQAKRKPTKLARFPFGNTEKHKLLRGSEVATEFAVMSGSLEDFLSTRLISGSIIEKRELAYIREVKLKGLWVRIEFMNGTSLKTKQYIRRWVVKNGFSFYDKPYTWTNNVAATSKYIAIGPWSAKPRFVSKEASHREFTIKSTK